MKSSTIVWLSLCFLIVVFTAQAVVSQTDVYKKFAGEYITGHDFGGGSITLNLDGTFSESGGSDDGTRVSTTGTYKLIDGKLVFKVEKSIQQRGDGPEINLLDPAELKRLYGSNAKGAPNEFVNIPIQWSGRIYLIPVGEMDQFANAINLGIEPRPDLVSNEYMGSPWLGSFFLRKGDEKIKAVGVPPLPKPWSDILLRRPIIAKIIKINNVEKREFYTHFTATINKGRRDGLRLGMRLVVAGEQSSPWWGTKVIAVQQKTAQIQISEVRYKLRVGEKVTSIYKSPYSLLK